MADFGRMTGAAAPGMSRLAMAIAGGPGGAYQRAYDNQLGLQSKLAQALASIEADEARADKFRTEAQTEQDQLSRRAPEAMLERSLLSHGIPTEERGAVDTFLKTGQLGGRYGAGPAGMGPTLPAPDWQNQLGAVARSLATGGDAIALGDKSVENLARAEGLRREQALSDAIIAGTANRNTVAGAQAAAGGKDLFSSDSTGAVLDRFQGNLDTNNPMAGSTIRLRGEQAGAQRANAAQSYAAGRASDAQARAADALAKQREAITAAGPSGAGNKAPAGYRWTSGPNGENRLEPIPGGPKDPPAKPAGGGKPLPSSAAKGHLDNIQNMQRAKKALALVEGKKVGEAQGDTDATGWKGFLPNTVLNYADPEGVETRAAIADLGSLVIHDRSGAAVTAAEFPRLAPFIPRATDDADTAKKKLKLFVQNYEALVQDTEEFYRASGYNVPTLSGQKPQGNKPTAAPAQAGGGPVQITSDAEYDALPSGTEFMAPDGTIREKP